MLNFSALCSVMLMAHGWRVGCLGKEQAHAWTINVLRLACDSEFVFFPWGFVFYYVLMFLV